MNAIIFEVRVTVIPKTQEEAHPKVSWLMRWTALKGWEQGQPVSIQHTMVTHKSSPIYAPFPLPPLPS